MYCMYKGFSLTGKLHSIFGRPLYGSNSDSSLPHSSCLCQLTVYTKNVCIFYKYCINVCMKAYWYVKYTESTIQQSYIQRYIHILYTKIHTYIQHAIYQNTHIHTYIHTKIRTHTIYKITYIHTYLHTYKDTYTYYIHTKSICIHTVHTYIHSNMRTCHT